MFDSLSDQIKHDEQAAKSGARRIIVWAGTSVLVLLLFGGVYLATRLIH